MLLVHKTLRINAATEDSMMHSKEGDVYEEEAGRKLSQ